MNIIFYFHTHSLNQKTGATLTLAGDWLSQQLKANYGGQLNTIIIELCVGNAFSSNTSPDPTYAKFETFLQELPIAKFHQKNTQLVIQSKLFDYDYHEIKRDPDILSLKLFQQVLNKSVQLLELAPTMIDDMTDIDNQALIQDVKMAAINAPNSLSELSQLYLQLQCQSPQSAIA